MKPLWTAVLILIWTPGLIAQTQLTPQDQIVRSNYLEQKEPPRSRAHQLDPRRPERIAEPYSPQILVANYAFEEDLPKNLKLHWLTRISGKLAAIFLGSRGVFEQGVQLYQAEEYAEAARRFESIYQRSGKGEQRAALWLAWSKYQLGEMDESFKLARLLQSAEDPQIAQEAYYLSALHRHRRGDLEGLDKLSSRALGTFDKEQRGFRLRYALLVAQVKLQHWPQARGLLDELQQEHLTYSPYYGKIKEIAGVIAYHEDDFKRALAEFERARQADPRAFAQSENLRYSAWLLYLSGDYPGAIERADQVLNDPLPQNREELVYLKIAALTHLAQGDAIGVWLSQLPLDSPFHAFAAFQVKAFLKDLDQRPGLVAQVAQVSLPFKNLRFYAALLDGNAFFRAGQYEEARQEYQKAQSQQTEGHYQWIAQYNLGLIDLTQEKWEKARQNFAALKKAKEPENKKWLTYHLLYTLYKLNQSDGFAKEFAAADLSELDQEIQWEVHILRGNLLLAQGKTDLAVKSFLWGWKQGERPEALEYAAQTLYGANRFTQVINLVKEHRQVSSDILLSYEIRSLLGLHRFREAKDRLEARGYVGERLLALHVEVWLAAQESERIIARVRPLLKAPELKDERRKAYYLTLADAYFNLKDFDAARQQYAQALELTTETAERSPLVYSLVLTHYRQPDRPAFIREADRALAAESLTPGVRLNLSLLLASVYLEQDQPQAARELLAAEEAKVGELGGKLRNRRAQLAFEQGDYPECAALGAQAPAQMSPYEQIDLALTSAQCQLELGRGEAAQRQLQTLPKVKGYRSAELHLFLAEALSQLGQAEASQKELVGLQAQKLSARLAQKARLSETRNLIALNRPEEAAKKLGDWQDYRAHGLEEQALKLNAAIGLKQEDPEEAARALLRLHYDQNLSAAKKADIDLKLAQIYLELKRPERAQEFLAGLPKELSEAQRAQKSALEKELKNLTTP
ncbi:MAG: tetratricopeptide repeat protein [bacterium]|nr:tetratricopeptide repeat protein [bacterium]